MELTTTDFYLIGGLGWASLMVVTCIFMRLTSRL